MTWEEFINSEYNPNSPDTGTKVFWLIGDSRIFYRPYTNTYNITDNWSNVYGTTVINSKVYIAANSGGSDD